MDPKIAKKTQDTLGKIIKKPPLTDKLLSKPPFRFLHDITTSVVKSTGFMKGLHADSELNSENVKDKDSKIAFLQKVIDMVGLVTGKSLSVKPAKIVAGHEPEKTNELLQALAQAISKQVDSDEYVKKVLNKDIVEEEKKDRETEKSEKRKKGEEKDDRSKDNEIEDKKHREKSRDREKSKDRDRDKDGEKKDRDKRDKSKHREEREERHKDRDERHRSKEDKHKDREEKHRDKEERHKDREERHRERKSKKLEEFSNSEEYPVGNQRRVVQEDELENQNESEDSNSSFLNRSNTSNVHRRTDRPGAAKYRTDRHFQKDSTQSTKGEATPGKRSVDDEKLKKASKTRMGVRTDPNVSMETKPGKEDHEIDKKRKKGTKSRIGVRSSPSKGKKSVDASEASSLEANKPRRRSSHQQADDNVDEEIDRTKSKKISSRKRDEEGKENESPEVNGEKGERIPRPTSAKGSRRRREDDEEEKKPSRIENESNIREGDLPPQVSNARQARPSSARPAPPRPKQDTVESEPSMRLGTGKPSNVIVDDDKQSDEDDDNFLVEDSGLPPPEPEQPPPRPENEDDEDHGGLVKKMLETKKELENQPSQGPQRKVDIERSAVSDAARRKQREQVKKEIDKLRTSIQSLTRSANPLGKSMDYVQEDLDSMQKELEKWKHENKEHALELKREKGVTDRAIEPLKVQLSELDQAIRDQLDASAAVKSNIIKNDQKIEKMLKTIARS